MTTSTNTYFSSIKCMGSRCMVAKVCEGNAETPAKPDPRGNEPNTDYENLQFFFHSDHLGSTSYITDLSGEVSQHVEYFPYGGIMTEERNNAVSEGNTPYLFNGKELDLETGLYYYGARYMEPYGSIWYGVDPLTEEKPWASGYNFVQNNPIMRFDPNGLTDYTLNKKTGDVKQVGEKNNAPDRVLKTKRKGEVKYNNKGQAKVAIDNIEQGILSDGMNFKENDEIIEVGGKGEASVEGVKSFTLQLSEYIGKELKGFSYSANTSGNITDMVLGKYKSNGHKFSYGLLRELQNKYKASFSLNNVLQQFHTHPHGELGATQSAPEQSKDVKNLQRDKRFIPNASFIILYRIRGRETPRKYDYTHEYRIKKR